MEKSLTKGSTSEEIKTYFEAVLALSKGDIAFPVNLDEVWGIVYPRKDHAVRELKENFIEGYDYVSISPKNGENPTGVGRAKDEYLLSLPCMEFFIARRVRAVFEVYRQVFHRATETEKTDIATLLTSPDLLIALATQLKERQLESQHLISLNARQEETIERQEETLRLQATKVNAYDRYVDSEGLFTTTQIAKEYGVGAVTLNSWLYRAGIQYKQNRQWILYTKYEGKGYTKSKPVTFTYQDGTEGTQMQTMWTTKGREFIHALLGDPSERKGGAR